MSYSLKKTGYIDQVSGEVIIIDLIDYIDSLENKFGNIRNSECVFLDKKVFEKSNLLEGYYYQISLSELDTNTINHNYKQNEEIIISANIAKQMFKEIENIDKEYSISFEIDISLTQSIVNESHKLNRKLKAMEKITSFFLKDYNQVEEEWIQQLDDLKKKAIENKIELNDHNNLDKQFQQLLSIDRIGILKASQIMHIINAKKFPVFSQAFYELFVYLGYCKEGISDVKKYGYYQIIVNGFISERLKNKKALDDREYIEISFQLYKFNILEFLIS